MLLTRLQVSGANTVVLSAEPTSPSGFVESGREINRSVRLTVEGQSGTFSSEFNSFLIYSIAFLEEMCKISVKIKVT